MPERWNLQELKNHVDLKELTDVKRFYKVAIDKRPIGTAIEHREPPVVGERITNVTDARTRGDFRVVVVDATDAEHQRNLALPAVEAVEEAEAVTLAARYQPEYTREDVDPRTGKVDRVTVPNLNLREVVAQRERERDQRGRPSGTGRPSAR